MPAWAQSPDDIDTETYSIEIIGTRNGNPGKVLGEVAAGVVLDADLGRGDGLAVVLDNAHQRLVIHDLSESAKVLVDRPAIIMPNTQHQLTVANVDGLLTVVFDDASPWSTGLPWPPHRRGTALLVDNAEAIFNAPHASSQAARDASLNAVARA